MHNLKNISVEIPRDKLVVMTGLSGSGKSSLAFDTIYAEGQRRYVESLSSYARQFLGIMDKPDVDQIEGLSPAISIDQKSVSHNPRSTVGTVTEIYDYLRLLFARIGRPHCPNCGTEIKRQTRDQITKRILALPKNTPIVLLAPLIRDQKGEHKNLLSELQKAGYSRVRFDGLSYPIEEALNLKIDKQKKHNIEVVIDRLNIDPEERSRLFESLETALELGEGAVIIHRSDTEEDLVLSERFACPKCGINIMEIEPRNFSFNSPHGACPACAGLGTKLEVDEELVFPNKNLTIAQGAVRPWARIAPNTGWHIRLLQEAARKHNFSIDVPVGQLSPKQLKIVLYGTGDMLYEVDGFEVKHEGIIPNLERRYKETDSEYIRSEIERYMRVFLCPVCQGKRLKPEVLSVTIADKSIDRIVSLTIERALEFFRFLEKEANRSESAVLAERERKIGRQIIKEIIVRLEFLFNVGLDYLTLDRAATTLSGGEAQRIRLATQIGSRLSGVIYILDEPSIGLHQRDNERLIATLKDLRDLGNTVIVVEHDQGMIESSDWVIDIGPGAGAHGGEVVAVGPAKKIAQNPKSITGKYLSGKLSVSSPKAYRPGNGKSIKILEAEEFNLKKVSVEIPLGKFVCITGVSGSGKSTLMNDILAKALTRHFYQSKDRPGKHKAILGLQYLDKVIDIDQSPIGRTPRSNPATYTSTFTPIRDLYTELPEARIRGYSAGRFSFNVKGGRCEACQGEGLVRIEMQFLSDVYVECEECRGRRYNKEALEIHYKGKNISDVLAMTVEEALKFFENIPTIYTKLKTLEEVGLGYIKLGQSATTLSGGEAQRVKLATELARRATGRTLYILDEPTTGLHFADVKRLLDVLQQLVDKGNTVLVIEHNLDVIKCADWIIDLGPEGGEKGGLLVAAGTPKDIVKVKNSYTGQFLKNVL